MIRLPLCAAFLALLTPIATSQTCALVADLSTGSAPSSPDEFTCCFGDLVFFSAAGNGIGQEPWVSKGGRTPVLLGDLRSGSAGSFPRDFVATGRFVFFTADDGNAGRELWVTDGSTSGTHLVKDIHTAPNTSSDIRDLVALDDIVLFRADDGSNGPELWSSDGTTIGTSMVRDIRVGATGSDPSGLVACNGRVLFAANDGNVGTELWTSDGTSAGTALVADLNPGTNSSSPRDLACIGNIVYFSARDATRGFELWSSDGTTQGTAFLADLNASGDSHPSAFTQCGMMVFFVAARTGIGFELWVHDAAGTRLVRDIRPGGASSSPLELTCIGTSIVFSAITDNEGRELWKSDGTSTGTSLVLDIKPGTTSSDPTDLTAVGTRVWFQATDDKANGLWRSDGNAASTQRHCPELTTPRHLVLCAGRVILSAYTTQTSHEPYMVLAPGASVTQFGTTCPPRRPFLTSTLPILGQIATLSGGNGLPNGFGVILLDVEARLPFAVPGGCLANVTPMFVLGVAVTTTWTLPVVIPNTSSLNGVALPIQTWWLPGNRFTPVRPTNAVLLGLGV
ncbi:MAG: hypothetical protein KDC95_12295 [Planctomycetes bacterium]|nr:hypothetical protein [Planctomycetota bacterium]